ncbi:MAG: single-stranded DNA-binding protein [Acholeplasmataceae bacterium]
MQVNGIIRLTKDPEVRKTQTGETVVNFDAAWNYGETGHFIRCTAWGKIAELIGESTKKGHRLYIIGKLIQSSFTTKIGETRKTHEVKVSQIEFIENKLNREKTEAATVSVNIEKADDLPF